MEWAFSENYWLEHISVDWWQSHDAFSRRTWFYKAWVIQEVALAQDILMLCDGNEVSWKHLVQLTNVTMMKTWDSLWWSGKRRQMVEEYAPPWLGGRPIPIGALVNSLRYRNEWEKLQKLLYKQRGAKSYMQICYAFFQQVLNTIRPFQTSDPRDMIYSILGKF